jgi:hypothetical protein
MGPDGQVGVLVASKDADSLEAWLDQHSYGETEPAEPQKYYRQVVNQRSFLVNGRPGIAFEWQAGGGPVVHAVVFFSGERVIDVHWFADVASYAATVEPIYDQMLESFQD